MWMCGIGTCGRRCCGFSWNSGHIKDRKHQIQPNTLCILLVHCISHCSCCSSYDIIILKFPERGRERRNQCPHPLCLKPWHLHMYTYICKRRLRETERLICTSQDRSWWLWCHLHAFPPTTNSSQKPDFPYAFEPCFSSSEIRWETLAGKKEVA